MKNAIIFLISSILLSACSGSSEKAGSPDSVEVTQFHGTWIACRNDSTAESTRITFIFDGDTAVFFEEYFSPLDCFTEPSSSRLRTGDLVFQNQVVDTALGFIAYSVIFTDSDPDEGSFKDLIYTDGNVVFFGKTSSELNDDGFPTSLAHWVSYEYVGQPDFSIAGL